mmetsp:Transcript_110832/g.308143  ORF Transcript_110832/g.308143 Transcript_110832/m.308143 type:complete len:212 (+) Transcript_110832:51-686(+)
MWGRLLERRGRRSERHWACRMGRGNACARARARLVGRALVPRAPTLDLRPPREGPGREKRAHTADPRSPTRLKARPGAHRPARPQRRTLSPDSSDDEAVDIDDADELVETVESESEADMFSVRFRRHAASSKLLPAFPRALRKSRSSRRSLLRRRRSRLSCKSLLMSNPSSAFSCCAFSATAGNCSDSALNHLLLQHGRSDLAERHTAAKL